MNVHISKIGARLIGVLVTACLACGIAWAQPCGCTTCPQPIAQVSDFTICYDVVGLVNPNLSTPSQGVCGVSVFFTHDYIENLSLTLRSPAGEEVQLLGPGISGTSTIATSGARWNVGFTDCATTPTPYPGTGPRFDGSSTVWQLLGNYTGTYHPFSGCLEDFDQGSANGEWCLRVQSNALLTRNDRLIDFAVEFCDDTGSACCEAEVPQFASSLADTTLCAGDSSLNLSFTYASTPAARYQQRVIIARDSLVVDYAQTGYDLRASPAGDYTLCAIQYYTGDANLLPGVGDSLNDLSSAGICYQQSLACTNIVVVPAPDTLKIIDEICEGSGYNFAGSTLTDPGTYYETFTSVGGCDSIVELRLAVHPLDTISFRQNLCQGDSLVFGQQVISAAGNYSIGLTNRFGCDSTLLLNVTELPSYSVVIDTGFCTGGSLQLGNLTIDTSGTFTQSFTTAAGCDSIITYRVQELNPDAVISALVRTFLCGTDSVRLGANTPAIPNGATFTRTWRSETSTLGDSIIAVAYQPGWYYLDHQLTFGNYTCSSTDSVLLDENLASPGILLPDSVLLNCANRPLQLVAHTTTVGHHLYEWRNGPIFLTIDSSVNITMPGMYTVIVFYSPSGCGEQKTVHVIDDSSPPPVTFEPPDTITCSVDSVLLDASASLSANVRLSWSDPIGNALLHSGGLAYATRPGDYELYVIDTIRGCSASQTVTVYADTAALTLTVQGDSTITCTADTLLLTATTNRAASLAWLSAAGDTISRQAELLVSQPGTYTAFSTALGDGCTAQQTVSIRIDTLAPRAHIMSATDTLRCFPPYVELTATDTAGLANVQYAWQQPVSNPDSSTVRATEGGVYEVVLMNPANGCSDSSSYALVADNVVPIADAGADRTIACDSTSVQVGGASSVGAEFTYFWGRVPVSGVGAAAQQLLTVRDSGEYVLSVRNTRNGCFARDTVRVGLAPGSPLVVLPDSVALDCNTSDIIISSSGSSAGPSFSYSWSTSDGQLLSPLDSLAARVSAAGTYRLAIASTASTCIGEAETTVYNPCAPGLLLAGADTINCATGPSITLAANLTTSDAVAVQWSTTTGTIIRGDTSLNPTVAAGGIYRIRLLRLNDGFILEDSVRVVVDTVAPRARIAGDLLLSCADVSSCVALDASGSTSSSSVTAAWSTISGRFCSDTVGQSVLINAPGLYELSLLDTLNGCSDLAQVSVAVESGVPVPDAGGDRVLACDQDSLRLVGGLPADTLHRSWWWTDAQGDTISGTSPQETSIYGAGVYAFVVSDSVSGCTVADSTYVIAQLCAPDARPVASNPISCRLTSAQLSSPPQSGMLASWSGVTTSLTATSGFAITVTAPGTYQLIVTDPATGSADTAQVVVRDLRVKPTARLTAPATITCADTTALLNAAASDIAAGGGLTFSWSGPAASPSDSLSSIEIDEPGRYAVVVESGLTGCRDTASLTIAVDTVAPTAVAIALSPLDCTGDAVGLDATSSGGRGGLGYRWRGLAGQAVQTPGASITLVTAAGEYELQVTDRANGCSALDTVTVIDVADIAVSAGPDRVLACDQTSLQLDGSAGTGFGASVRWIGPTATCFDDAAAIQPTISCPGSYMILVTDDLTGCTYFDVAEVTQEVVDLQVAIVGDSILNCRDVQLDLQAQVSSEAVAFAWSGVGAGTSATTQVTTPGEVVLVAQNNRACTDSTVMQIVQDTVAPFPVLAEADTLTCSRRQVLLAASLSGGRNYRLQWTGPAANLSDTLTTVRVGEPGQYQFTAVDSDNFCSGVASMQVVRDTSTVQVDLVAPGGTQFDCNIDLLTLSATVSPATTLLEWSGPRAQALDDDALRQNISVPGLYQLTAYHFRTGCSSSDGLLFTDVGMPVSNYTLAEPALLGCTPGGVALISTLPQNTSITWTDAAGGAVDPTAVHVAGVYTARLRDAVTGCRTIDSVEVEVYQPGYTISIAEPDSLTCAQAEVTLRGATAGAVPNNISYRWIDPTGDTLAPAGALALVVRVGGLWQLLGREAASGCIVADSVLVPVSAEAIEAIVLDVVDATCPGERDGHVEVVAIEGGTAPFAYVLDGGRPQAVGQFGLLSGGVYELQVIDGNGCSYQQDVTVSQAEVKQVVLPAEFEVQLGDTLCFAPQVEGVTRLDSVRWYPRSVFACDTCSAGCVLAQAEVAVRADVWVDGCMLQAESLIKVIDGGDVVWPTAFSPNGDGVNDEWRAYPLDGAQGLIRVYDRWGSIIFSTDFREGDVIDSWDGSFGGKRLNPGVFLVEAVGRHRSGREFRVHGEVVLLK